MAAPDGSRWIASVGRVAQVRGRLALGIENESALIARLRSGERAALGALYHELGADMTTLARSILRDTDEAADVVEDSLVRIHHAAAQFRGERGLRTWVLRIVVNQCRDRIRRRRFIAGRADEMDPIAHAGLRSEPVEQWDRAIDQRKLLAALERAIADLPPDQQEAVVLRDRMGLSYEEAAETQHVAVGAFKSRLFRARETLKRVLKEQFDAGAA